MNAINMNYSSAQNVAGRDINITEIPKIISIRDAIQTEDDELLHQKVSFFLKEHLKLTSHFSEIINLESDHYIEHIKEIPLPPMNWNEELTPYKEYQLALDKLPAIEINGKKWFFYHNRSFIYFDNPPYALILDEINRPNQYAYREGYRANNTILDMDMLKELVEHTHKSIEQFEITLCKDQSSYSHAFFTVVLVEIERLSKLYKKWLEELTIFIAKYQNHNRIKAIDGSDQHYKVTATQRKISMNDIFTNKMSEFDIKMYSTTSDLIEVLQSYLDRFNKVEMNKS